MPSVEWLIKRRSAATQGWNGSNYYSVYVRSLWGDKNGYWTHHLGYMIIILRVQTPKHGGCLTIFSTLFVRPTANNNRSWPITFSLWGWSTGQWWILRKPVIQQERQGASKWSSPGCQSICTSGEIRVCQCHYDTNMIVISSNLLIMFNVSGIGFELDCPSKYYGLNMTWSW